MRITLWKNALVFLNLHENMNKSPYMGSALLLDGFVVKQLIKIQALKLVLIVRVLEFRQRSENNHSPISYSKMQLLHSFKHCRQSIKTIKFIHFLLCCWALTSSACLPQTDYCFILPFGNILNWVIVCWQIKCKSGHFPNMKFT